MSDRTIYITDYDMQRLKELIADIQGFIYNGREDLKQLKVELERSQRVVPDNVPGDVVTMNSTVCLTDLESGEEMTYTLVFPKEADIRQGRLSVLAPIGTAMLGHRVGDTFEWQVPDGTRRLKVEKILYQPEAAGDYHL